RGGSMAMSMMISSSAGACPSHLGCATRFIPGRLRNGTRARFLILGVAGIMFLRVRNIVDLSMSIKTTGRRALELLGLQADERILQFAPVLESSTTKYPATN